MASILVVEDEGIVARDIQNVLERLGHVVPGIAASAAEAVRKAGTILPDLVLMDIVLRGDMDGVEAAERIREGYDIPVVYLTAYADDPTLQRARATDPFGYILKPFEERELRTTIDIALYRHHMERKLRASQEWLATTLASIGDAVVATDEGGRVVFMNRIAEEITGWAESAALGHDASEVVGLAAAGAPDAPEHPVARALREGGVVSVADGADVISGGGGRVAIGASAAAIRDEKGLVKGSVLVFRDVTDRRRADAALRASEERYRAIFENAVEGIFQTTPSGRFLAANPAMARVLGYASPGDLFRETTDIEAQHYVEPARRREFKAILDAQGSVSGFLTRIRRHDGATVWLSVNARAVRGAGGEIRYYEGTAEDVTERQRVQEAEAELRVTRERAAREWELTFDSMEAPILILDAAGRVARLNRAARALSGQRRYQDVLGREVARAGPGEPWRKASELAAEVARTRSRAQAEVHDRANGKTWDLSAGPCPGAEAGDERVLVVARDVTRMSDLQASLRRSETMSTMGMLVAGVAHEVRNPLFSISAHLDAFEARIGERAEFSPTIIHMRAEVERLATLMQGLLDYGKPVQEASVALPVHVVVAEAVQHCASLARSRKVSLVNGVASGLPPVAMDRRRLVQVFQNLLQNAIQHSVAGDCVTVEATRRDGGDRSSVVLTVTDSGPGLAPEDLDRVFEPFFSRRRGGTGLGLAIAQRIVEEHGGTVRAANRPGGGAALTVQLPCEAGGPYQGAA